MYSLNELLFFSYQEWFSDILDDYKKKARLKTRGNAIDIVKKLQHDLDNIPIIYDDEKELARSTRRLAKNFKLLSEVISWKWIEKGITDDGFFDIESLKKANVLSPNSEITHDVLGVAYCRCGSLDAAMSEYKKALSINPKSAATHNNLGVIYSRKGFLTKAMSEYTKALNYAPNSAVIHNNIGVIYAKQKKFNQAVDKFESIYNATFFEKTMPIDKKDKEAFTLGLRTNLGTARLEDDYDAPAFFKVEGFEMLKSNLRGPIILAAGLANLGIYSIRELKHSSSTSQSNFRKGEMSEAAEHLCEAAKLFLFEGDFGETIRIYYILKLTNCKEQEEELFDILQPMGIKL